MKTAIQIKEAISSATLAIFLLKRKSATLLGIYLFTAIIIFGVTASLLVIYETSFRNALMEYLFPQSWHGVVDTLANFFFQSQAKIVFSNLIISSSVVAASVLLFPIKERCSAAYEIDAGLGNIPTKTISLIFQLWEETKLLLFYVTAQLTILWIGYYSFAWAQPLSITLSLLFLFFSFALDLLSPTLQRHGISYTFTLKLLLANPVACLGFGAIFTFPVIFLGATIFSIESLSLLQMSIIVFLTNLFMLTLAIPGGTKLAHKLLPETQTTCPPSVTHKSIGYVLLLLLLSLNLFFHSRLALSMHHKSQLLKCEYDVDWHSFDIDLPSLESIKKGMPSSAVSFVLTAKNPTAFDLVIENSVLSLEHKNKVVTTIEVSEFILKAGTSSRQKIHFNSSLHTHSLAPMKDLLHGWAVNLEFELWPGIPFVVNIIQ